MTAHEIKAINERIAHHSARVRELELQVQIQQQLNALGEAQSSSTSKSEASSAPSNTPAASNSTNSIGPEATPVQRPKTESEHTELLPSVLGIEGIDGNLQAILRLHDRTLQIVRVGESLNSGWKVVGINVNQVHVSKDDNRVTLPFGDRVQQLGNADQAAGGYGADSYSAPYGQF
jgi:type IV pilus biogenesis protein PilP